MSTSNTSWAKRTGFRPKFSGEAAHVSVDSGPIRPTPVDLELGRTRNGTIAGSGPVGTNVEPGRAQNGDGSDSRPIGSAGVESGRVQNGDADKDKREEELNGGSQNANGQVGPPLVPARRDTGRSGQGLEVLDSGGGDNDDDGFVGRHSHMKYELRDSPGFVPVGFYGLQHYFSILGSIVLIPLVIVPAMGGSYEDTANVISSVFFITGVTTLLHTNFGSRLPLIQGPSFVFLALALAIVNSPEFQKLKGNNFKHIMKELQGAIIIASAFQTFLGYSGLMSLLAR